MAFLHLVEFAPKMFLRISFAIIVSSIFAQGIGMRVASAETESFVISSDSMEPTLHVNDLITVDKNVPFDSLQVGNIIAFHQPANASLISISRIVDVQINGSAGKIVKTRGDANQDSIPGVDYPITSQLYIGKLVGIEQGVGILTKIFAPPVGPLIGIAIVGVAVYYGVKRRKKKNQSGEKG